MDDRTILDCADIVKEVSPNEKSEFVYGEVAATSCLAETDSKGELKSQRCRAEISKCKTQDTLTVCKTVCRYHRWSGFSLWELGVWTGVLAVCMDISENACLDKPFQATSKRHELECWSSSWRRLTGIYSAFWFWNLHQDHIASEISSVVSLSRHLELRAMLQLNWD